MSCSKWAYEPEKCDGEFCPGDCDLCVKAYFTVEEQEMRDEDIGIHFNDYSDNDCVI